MRRRRKVKEEERFRKEEEKGREERGELKRKGRVEKADG